MTGKVQPKKRKFEFVLSIQPQKKLNSEQNNALFKEGVEKIPRTGIYARRSTNFLAMFLVLDFLENENPCLGLGELSYKLIKKEKEMK